MAVNSYACVYEFTDADRNRSTARATVPTALYSYETAETHFLYLADAIKQLSDAVLIGLSISRDYNYSSGTIPASTSDIVRCGLFIISLADDYYMPFVVPSIKTDLILLDVNGKSLFLLNPGDARYLDFRALVPQMTDDYSVIAMDIVIAGVAI